MAGGGGAAVSESPWAARLPPDKPLAAASLRLRADVSVLSTPDGLWLRGPNLGEDLDHALRKIPGAVRYTCAADGALTPMGVRLSTAQLPDGAWSPLSTWMELDPQPAALSGEPSRRASLRLVRSNRMTPASAIVARIDDWTAWAVRAPLVRLRALRFAADRETGGALVRGSPVPSIAGRPYTEEHGILLPSGFAFEPEIGPASVRLLLDIAPDDVALFDEDGSWQCISESAFVAATRPAARATAAAVCG